MSAEPNYPLEEGKLYRARIIDQIVTRSVLGYPQVLLTVVMTGCLRSAANLADGIDDCPPLERAVHITLNKDDPDRLAWAIRDLERLGFTDDDISRLHPDHPDFYR